MPSHPLGGRLSSVLVPCADSCSASPAAPPLGSVLPVPAPTSLPDAQEFLKRIPSSNSLAAFGSHGSQLDLAAQGLQLSTIQQVASQAAAVVADGAGFNLSGVPRVNSLDFFRQLHVNLPVNQLNVAGSRPAAGARAGFSIILTPTPPCTPSDPVADKISSEILQHRRSNRRRIAVHVSAALTVSPFVTRSGRGQ